MCKYKYKSDASQWETGVMGGGRSLPSQYMWTWEVLSVKLGSSRFFIHLSFFRIRLIRIFMILVSVFFLEKENFYARENLNS